MTSAYGGEPGNGRAGLDAVACLPIRAVLSTGRRVEVAAIEEREECEMMEMLNEIIDEGRAWPFDAPFATMDGFRGYFLSHAAFVCRALEPVVDADGRPSPAGEIVGCFYVKPNFPGRCSHVCNGGFITKKRFRKQGAGRLMGACFLRLARDLGYTASYFNLVFEANDDSVRLWDGLGFTRVAALPCAAHLKGIHSPVTAFGYYYDLAALPPEFDPVEYASRPRSNRLLKHLWRRYQAAAPLVLPACLLAVLCVLVRK